MYMAETSIEGNDAAAEQYREFTIESGARGPTAHWFRIQRAGQDEFRFTLYLTPLQIRGVKSEGLSDDAEKVGRGTVHGLIDLARYQRGRSYRGDPGAGMEYEAEGERRQRSGPSNRAAGGVGPAAKRAGFGGGSRARSRGDCGRDRRQRRAPQLHAGHA